MGRIPSTPLLVELGKSIKKQREVLGLSQEDLAEAAGLHRTYVSDLERGCRILSVLTLLRLSEALDIPVAALFVSSHKRHD